MGVRRALERLDCEIEGMRLMEKCVRKLNSALTAANSQLNLITSVRDRTGLTTYVKNLQAELGRAAGEILKYRERFKKEQGWSHQEAEAQVVEDNWQDRWDAMKDRVEHERGMSQAQSAELEHLRATARADMPVVQPPEETAEGLRLRAEEEAAAKTAQVAHDKQTFKEVRLSSDEEAIRLQ